MWYGMYWKLLENYQKDSLVLKCYQVWASACWKPSPYSGYCPSHTCNLHFIIGGEDFRRAPGLSNGPLLKVRASIPSQLRPCLKGWLSPFSQSVLLNLVIPSGQLLTFLKNFTTLWSQVPTYLLTTWKYGYKSEGCWVVALSLVICLEYLHLTSYISAGCYRSQV